MDDGGVREQHKLVEMAAVLASATRMHVLSAVGPRGCSVGEAARRVNISQSTASYHLERLLDVGLVRVARQGRRHIFRWSRQRLFLATEVVDDLDDHA